MHRIHGGNRLDIAERYGYSGYRKETLIDFSASINPLGPPACVLAILKGGLEEITHYPDLKARGLKQALAEYLQPDKENIILGNGSVEIIFLLAQRFRPTAAFTFSPTFCEYELAVQAIGGKTSYFELKKEQGFYPDIDEVLDWLSKENSQGLLFLCNPNNPTGVLLSKKDLLRIIARAEEQEMLVVVDEAFIDFVEEKGRVTLVGEAAERHNLIVLGSLSKFFALAGLRLGYAVSNPKLVKGLQTMQAPWNVNVLAQMAGEVALRDKDFISQSLENVKENRELLFNSLKEVKGLYPYPSAANFLLVEIKSPNLNSLRLQDELARRGIIIRDCSTFRGLSDKFFRIAVRSRSENEQLILALKEIMVESTYARAGEI